MHDNNIKWKILELHHNSCLCGHPRQFKTQELITCNYWWPQLTQYVNCYMDRCQKCQVTKIFPQKPQGLLSLNTTPLYPFEIISVDFITSLPESHEHDAIMVVVDCFSKHLYAIPCNKEINSEGTAWIFHNHVWQYKGLPKLIISDWGGQFASSLAEANAINSASIIKLAIIVCFLDFQHLTKYSNRHH